MEPLTFFFDRTFGKRLPRALFSMKPPMEIHWHQEQKFPQNMPDDEWLDIVCRRKWVVLSQDRKFHVLETEAAAIKQHQGRCFYMPCASEDRWISLGHFVRRHQRMMGLARSEAVPFIYELKGNGQLYRVRFP